MDINSTELSPFQFKYCTSVGIFTCESDIGHIFRHAVAAEFHTFQNTIFNFASRLNYSGTSRTSKPSITRSRSRSRSRSSSPSSSPSSDRQSKCRSKNEHDQSKHDSIYLSENITSDDSCSISTGNNSSIIKRNGNSRSTFDQSNRYRHDRCRDGNDESKGWFCLKYQILLTCLVHVNFISIFHNMHWQTASHIEKNNRCWNVETKSNHVFSELIFFIGSNNVVCPPPPIISKVSMSFSKKPVGPAKVKFST